MFVRVFELCLVPVAVLVLVWWIDADLISQHCPTRSKRIECV